MRLFILFAILSQSSPAAEFGYEDLVTLIQTRELTSIEALLPLLPEEFRSNYALMAKSKSLQQADPLAPRIILFGEDAKLTCAFNGDSTQAGNDSLECIQFRDQERAFDFRQIVFPTADNGATTVRFSNRGQTVDGLVACSSCHGADPRPNWDQYNIWEGAYGAFDDHISGDKSYPEFVKRRGSHPRYQWLIQADYPEAPFDNDTEVHVSTRPNLRFSDFIGKWNALRASRLLAQTASKREQIAFAASVLECASVIPTLERDASEAGIDFKPELYNDILDRTKIPKIEWGTHVTVRTFLDTYQHEGGFGLLLQDMSMSIVQDLALAGDLELAKAVTAVRNSYRGYGDTEHFQRMSKIVPDIAIYLGSHKNNLAVVCPPLVAQLLKKE